MTKTRLTSRFNQHLQTLCAALLLATALPASGQTAAMVTGAAPMSVPGTSLMATSALNSVPASSLAPALISGANQTDVAGTSANPNQRAEQSSSDTQIESAADAEQSMLLGKDRNNAQGDEFQRYVGNVLGTSLPIFGSHLFTGGPSTYAPVDNVPVTSDYVLGPGV